MRILIFILIPFWSLSQSTTSVSNFANSVGISYLKPKMDFWSDGSSSGDTLFDISGNARHGILTSNIVSDPGAELGSTLIDLNLAFPCIVKTSSNVDAHSGTYCFDVQIDGAPAFAGVRTKKFIVVSGETINWSFWIKRISSSLITYTIRQGDNSNLATGNCNTAVVGTWTQFSGSASVTQSGALAEIVFSTGAGDYDFRIDDMSYTVSGATNNCFYLPTNANLIARDSHYFFFDALGKPITIRAAYTAADYHNKRIYCGGAFEYVFLNQNPTIADDYILARDFEDLDHVFDSCPKVITVGNSGKDYTTVQAAINGTAAGTQLDRRRIDVYDNLSPATIAEYTAVVGVGAGSQNYIAINKQFFYISAAPGLTITLTANKENTASDVSMGSTAVYSPIYAGGLRDFVVTKRDGGYLIHHHFSGNNDSEIIYKNCSFTDLGSQEIIDYRIANSLPYSGISNGKSAMAAAFVNASYAKIDSCTFSGIFPMTWHDQDVTSSGGFLRVKDCTFNSVSTIYDPIYNPGLTLHENLLLTNHNSPNSTVFLQRENMDNVINQVSTPVSIILTEY